MSSIQVREARPEDDAAVGELLVRAFVESYAREMPEVVVTERRKADLRDVRSKRQAGLVLVAVENARLLGAVTLLPPRAPGSEAWLPGFADLRQLGISLEARGQGVSSLLLAETESRARAWGCQGICLHVRRGAHGVARMYAGRGYQRSPEGDLDHLPEIFLEGYLLSF